MENPGSSCLVYNRSDYRSCLICFLPTLVYLDDAKVTKSERIDALRNIETYHLMTDVLTNVVSNEGKLIPHNEAPDGFKEDSDDEEYIAFQSHSYPT